MVIINPKNNKIKATRGDTIICNIDVVDSDGNPYVADQHDQLRFAVKKDYNDEECLILKTIPIDTMQLRVEGAETKELDQPGEYVYDIQLTYGDGIISTIISSTLSIVEEVE